MSQSKDNAPHQGSGEEHSADLRTEASWDQNEFLASQSSPEKSDVGPPGDGGGEGAAGGPHAAEQGPAEDDIDDRGDDGETHRGAGVFPAEVGRLENACQNVGGSSNSEGGEHRAGDTSVFVWGGATNTDGPPSERSDLGASAAIRAASQAIFAAARMGIDDVGLFDLYSAFPSAFQVAAAALGIATDDSRGLTVTGGMPFFGGPGNNYSSHAIASLVEKLRLAGGLGLIAANGGYLSKHSLGLYGTSPPPHGFHAADTAAAQARIEDAAPVSSLEATGEARVEGGTVVYARDGSVASAPVIARLDDGRRIVAQAESSLLAELAGQSLVGRRILVAGSPILYRL